jgi:hypothetical protein
MIVSQLEPEEKKHLFALLNEFQLVSSPSEIKVFGNGLINSTFKVDVESPELDGYVLQKINIHVFPSANDLMDNILLVQEKFSAMNRAGTFPFQDMLTFVPTKLGNYYFKDTSGNHWRVSKYIKDSICFQQVESVEQAKSAGWAFGQFHKLLGDVNPATLKQVIPNFHHIGVRLMQLEAAKQGDQANRLETLDKEIAWIAARTDAMCTLIKWGESDLLPTRILHYDPKINNVLFDAQNRVHSVIDLDTVMPGYLAYDFGDAIRSLINTAPEDEPDLNKIQLNIPHFEAYAKGYLSATQNWITPKEVDSLIFGVLLLPYMQAVRFLTDYLNGDQYYKIEHKTHNLQRAKAQMKLVELLESQERNLSSIIQQIYRAKN